MSKRAQVTVFIIIGILMLFLFAGVLYITKSTTEKAFKAEKEPVIEDVPQEFIPIKTFTENCLRSVGKRGLILLGQQGGYIYPEVLGEFSVINPTDSAGINLEPAKVPYWSYNQEPNRGDRISLVSGQPKLHDDGKEGGELSMGAQLGRYVEEKLEECLDDYNAFKGEGYEIQKEGAEAEVTIGEKTVNFLLKMPLEAKKGERKDKMELFYVKIPLDLKYYYEIGGLITEAEENYSFLERQALDLIQVFSAVDVNKLPPTSAVTFELVPTVYWSVPDVKEKLKGMLVSYVPMLRFLGSRNMFRYEYPVSELSGLYQKNYDNMILPLSGGENLEISFDYFGWEPYFDVNSKGDKIEPQHLAVNYGLLHFGTQHYYTVYDLSYPVLVTLRDEAAFEGEGYTFVFALESNIRNNKPAEKEQELLPAIAAFSKSMVCDEDKYDTELLKTVVVDSSTGELLEAVQIGFSIPEQDDCTMGLTDAEGEFESEYPAVYGGVLNFVKEDYLTNFYPIDTYRYKEKPGIIGYAAAEYSEYSPEVIEMHPFKTINISVKKKNLEKCVVEETPIGPREECYYSEGLFPGGEAVYSDKPELLGAEHKWIFNKAASPLKETEQAIITLNRVGDQREGVFNQEFTTGAGVAGEEKQEVELVPGIYEVTGSLVLNEEVVIPEEERCKGGFWGAVVCLFGDCCFTIDEVRMEKYMSGQISWDNKKTYLKITPEELYGSKEITFYILSQNIKQVPVEAHKRVVEDMKVMGEMGNISKMAGVREALEPRFS